MSFAGSQDLYTTNGAYAACVASDGTPFYSDSQGILRGVPDAYVAQVTGSGKFQTTDPRVIVRNATVGTQYGQG